MTNLIKTTLGIPVQEDISAAVPDKYAVVDVYAEESGLVGNGEDAETVSSYQIDLFYKDATLSQIRTAGQALKSAIKTTYGAKVSNPSVRYTYDVASRYRRATLTFELLEG